MWFVAVGLMSIWLANDPCDEWPCTHVRTLPLRLRVFLMKANTYASRHGKSTFMHARSGPT
jgi:hypothetical protein